MSQKRHRPKGPRVKDQLRHLEVRPSKGRGQNFVIDPTVTAAILEFGAPHPEEHLVEIGPGLGALTAELARFPTLTLIEIEPKFCAELGERFPGVRIINEDVRAVDFGGIGRDLVVFGNLPYAFSTDIVFHLIGAAPYLKRAVLLLQREFAERLAAAPGGRDYGLLSVSAQVWSEMRLGPIIPGTAFHPPARVESRVIELSFRREPRVPVRDPLWFKRVVSACFLKRRKKVVNSLLAAGLFQKEQILAGLAAAGVDPNRRAETMSIEEFFNLSEALPNPMAEWSGQK